MLGHFRYFPVICFIAVLALGALAGLWFRSFVTDGILRTILEKDNITVAESVAMVLSQRHEPAIRQAANGIPLTPEFSQAILQDTGYLFTLQPLIRLVIYDSQGKILFEHNKTQSSSVSPDITHAYMAPSHLKEELAAAKSTGFHSTMVMDENPLSMLGLGAGGAVLRTVAAVESGKISRSGKVDFFIELAYDVGPVWKHPLKIQLIVTLVTLGIFFLIYLAFHITTSRAEKVIARQHEANIELVTAKMKAERENIEKSKFLANISHELRTPLNAIIGFSEIIRDEVMGPIGNPHYKDYVNDIYASGVHLLSLINDILDYSKAEAGKLEVQLSDVDVTKLMKSCLRLVSPKAEEAGVALINNIPADHFVVHTDPKRFKQILLNLLSNAIKFTPAKGTVSLYAWQNVLEQRLVIEIQDTGIGISPKDISLVMSTFGQVDNEYNRKHEGTGLGLPLSKKLVELMGGTFHLTSEVGTGTKVTISLTLSDALPSDQVATA